MQRSKLPAGMDEVAGPLAEAAEYERLALERRKGALSLVTAVSLAILVAFKLQDWSLSPLTPLGGALFAFVLASTAGLQLLLRNRPGWEPLFARPKGRQYWTRYALGFGTLLVAVVLAGLVVYQPGFDPGLRAALPAAMFGSMGLIFLWLLPKQIPSRYGFLGGWIAAALLATGVVPDSAMIVTIFACAGATTLVEAGYRLLAPRRWLVR